LSGSSKKNALEKLKYDFYYIKNMSVVMDLMVIFRTVKTVLLARGSRWAVSSPFFPAWQKCETIRASYGFLSQKTRSSL